MNKKIFSVSLFISFLCIFPLNSSENPPVTGFEIEISAPQLINRPLKLLNYFNERHYLIDSVMLSDEGTGVLKKDRKLQEGLYLILIDSTWRFTLLIGDEQVFHLAIDTVDLIMNMRVEGSMQTEAYFTYAQFITKQKRAVQQISKEEQVLVLPEKASKKEKEKMELKKKSLIHQKDSINQLVFSFQTDFFEKHKDDWVGKYFKGINPVDANKGPFPFPNNSQERYQQFLYIKNHYFDNVDLSDLRFWYTDFFPLMIEKYIKNYVEPPADSLANAASSLVAKVLNGGNTNCFRLMLSKLFNYAIQSDLMGMENVWAKLAEDYYLNGMVADFDSTQYDNLLSEYTKIKYNRIGMKAQNLHMMDSIGNPVELYQVAKRYTLIYFYEPTCSHCKKMTPEMYNEVYLKFRDKGLEVFCVNTMTDRREWMRMINEGKLTDWINVWDVGRTSHFWEYYNTSTTPSTYLINENKMIIAKKLDVAGWNRLLSNLLNSFLSN